MLKAEKGPLDECFRVHLFHFRSQQRGGSGGGRGSGGDPSCGSESGGEANGPKVGKRAQNCDI